jgi:ribosome-dependent ATPase
MVSARNGMAPSILFSGMMQPVSSLEGGAAIIGKIIPTTYFMNISVGTFTKGLGFGELSSEFAALLIFLPILTALSVLLLNRQER